MKMRLNIRHPQHQIGRPSFKQILPAAVAFCIVGGLVGNESDLSLTTWLYIAASGIYGILELRHTTLSLYLTNFLLVVAYRWNLPVTMGLLLTKVAIDVLWLELLPRFRPDSQRAA